MLPLAQSGPVPETWQRALRECITDSRELLKTLDLKPEDAFVERSLAERTFPLRVPRSFVSRMKKGDPHDPLLLQVLPTAAELHATPGFSIDPVNESNASEIPGLLHKYAGRVLVLVSGACAVNCRYCFRRHFPYSDHAMGPSVIHHLLSYLNDNVDIHEVILSGGDPLFLTDDALAKLAKELEGIAHISTLRIHSRLPIVIPERITGRLLAWFTGGRLRPVMVIHTNHPNELDTAVGASMKLLRDNNVLLLNQSVLLKGVNDDAHTLARLSERLFEIDVLPYYLHLLDRVQGAAHFEVDEPTGQQLVAKLSSLLPGYLVPRLVREVPGAVAKQWIPVPLMMI